MVPPSSSSKRKEPPESSPNVVRPYSKSAAKEDRRKRGEIACAECRRLKVRCDRQIPCSTCVSRGCTALCPNGVLPPGENSRFVAKSKEHLQKKLSKMEERMRTLEDALAIAQAADTPEPHPLLATPWRIDDDEDEHGDQDGKQKLDDHAEDALVNTFGTLHVDEKHRTVRFFGPSGGAESLLEDKDRSGLPAVPDLQEVLFSTDLRALGLPGELDVFYHAFPLAPPIGVPRTHVRATIESYLPSPERADSLCRIFFNHMSWMFQIVTYQQVTQDLMPPFYGRADGSDATTNEDGPHDLALLLIVFAVGALVDLSLPAYNAEAQRYHVLARAALALQPLMDKASLNTVKTLHLISIFNGMSGKESNMANTYTVLNLAGRIAQRIGLHVDPSNWNLSEKEIYARRSYFWSLLQGDMIQCLSTGRPPALADTWHCVTIPTEEEQRAYQEKEIAAIGFGVWAYRYFQECMLPVVRIIMPAKSPSYQMVLDLDRKIRSFHSQEDDEPPESSEVSISMRRWVRAHFIDIILLSLHRGFFAQAVTINPANPLDTPYRQSFLTAYRCACHVIQTTSEQWMRYPQLLARVWIIWSLNFMSALIVGVVASQAKHLALDPPPFVEFERACELFQDASETNSRAAAALPVLLSMREQAIRLNAPLSEQTVPSSQNTDIIAPKLLRSSASSSVEPILPQVPPAQASDVLVDPSAFVPQYPPSLGAESTSQPAYHWQSAYTQETGYTQHYVDIAVPSSTPNPGYIAPPQAGLNQWTPAPVSYPVPPQGPPVDFILGDSWSTFMEHYGRLAH